MMSTNRNPAVFINIVVFAFSPTCSLTVMSANSSAKCSLIRFRSYCPQLNPNTGSWSHQPSSFLCCFPCNRPRSSGTNSSLTRARIFVPCLSSSSMNRRTSLLGSESQRWVGVLPSVSPKLTEIGTWTFS